MKKMILGAVVAALCAMASPIGAASSISPSERSVVDNFPTKFSNQTACIAGVHYMRSAYFAVAMLNPLGYKTMGLEGDEKRYLQELLLDEMPSIYQEYGVSNQKLGINIIDYKSYMLAVMKMQHSPEYSSQGYMGIFADQMKKCYTHFNEFTEEDEFEFDIIDSVGLPQDLGWDAFETVKDYKDDQGKRFKLDFDGNRIK